VAVHRCRMAESQGADCLQMYVVLTANEGHQPGQLLPLDISGQYSMHSLQTRLRKTRGAHKILIAPGYGCWLVRFSPQFFCPRSPRRLQVKPSWNGQTLIQP